MRNFSNLIYSLDAWSSWTQISSPEGSDIGDIIFPDSLHGFAVGKEGVILKYNPPIVDDVSDYDDVVPNSFELFQNYPNPFNPTTNIKFTIPTSPPFQGGEARQGWFVQLLVYDVLGNEVATLVDEEKPTGSYEVEFDAAGLTSGIYFYRIRPGNF